MTLELLLVDIDNNHIYVFGGYNPNYMNQYVDKIEKFIIKIANNKYK